MFIGCDLYLYDGLLLNEEICKKLRMTEITRFPLIAILDNFKIVIKLTPNGVIHAESRSVKQELMKNSKNQEVYFYIKRGDYIILPTIDIYYGISNGEELISVYKDSNLRNAKLYHANTRGFVAIFDDVKENQELIASINSQRKHYQSYEQLQYYKRNNLD